MMFAECDSLLLIQKAGKPFFLLRLVMVLPRLVEKILHFAVGSVNGRQAMQRDGFVFL